MCHQFSLNRDGTSTGLRRSASTTFSTAPLRALWDSKKIHKGGYYHDGRFATLKDVIEHYNEHLSLGLTDKEKNDLLEYSKVDLDGQPASGQNLTNPRTRARARLTSRLRRGECPLMALSGH